jgi:hypothetical protein
MACGNAAANRLENAPRRTEHRGAIHKATRLFKTTGGYTSFFSAPIYIQAIINTATLVHHNFAEAMIAVEEFNAEQVRIAPAEKLRGKAIATPEPRRVISRHLLSGLRCGPSR